MIRLQQPWSLLVLLFLPLLLVRLRGLSWGSAARRGAAWLCLALALTAPQIRWGSAPETLMVVLDLSASTSRSLRDGVARVRDLLRGTVGGGPVGVVGFAATAHLIHPANGVGQMFDVAAGLDEPTRDPWRIIPGGAREETDLAAGLDLAGWAFPPGQQGRVLLVTDGWETQGDAGRAARDLAQRGIVVDILPLDTKSADVHDASIETVEAPARSPRGLPFEVRATLRSTADGPAIVSLLRDRQPVMRQTVQIVSGKREVRFPVTAETPGMYRYGIQVTTPGDEEPRNDLAETSVTVTDRAQILWIGTSGAAPRGHDFSVTPARPDLPADLVEHLAQFDAVVLADVDADALPPRTAAELRRYVGSLGGGLLLLGGAHSLGAGGYRGTPVEEILPVALDPGDRRTRPGLGLVIVLDKSGSMAEAMGDVPKIRAAREAVLAAAGLLEPGDRLGLLAFDAASGWALPLQEAPAAGGLQALLAQVGPGGGTRILPALSEAATAFRGLSGWRRHVVLVTDGQGEGGDFAGTARTLAAEGITLSCVAVGDDADVRLLRELAAAGGGRLELARDATRLAAALRREVVAARGPLVREGRAEVAASPHPVLGDSARGPFPPVFGYVATTPKPLAAVPLRTETGEPLLALGPFGLGRTAVLMTDLEGPWGTEWRRWDGASRLVANVLRWLLRPPVTEQIAIRQEPARSGWDLVVQAADLDGSYLDGRVLRAHLHTEGDPETAVALEPRGPGTYAGALPSRLTRPTLVVLEDRTERDTRIVARAHLGLSYPEEYRIGGPHHALLENIGRTTGGRLLGEKGGVLALRQATPREYPLWPGLAWLGLGLFLAELALGRSGQNECGSGAPLCERTRFGLAWAVGRLRAATRADEGSRERACTRS